MFLVSTAFGGPPLFSFFLKIYFVLRKDRMNKTNSVCHKRGSSGRRKTKELLGRLTETKHLKNINTVSPDDVFNAT